MLNSKNNYIIQFLYAFILVIIGLNSPAMSLIDVSGDANSIWQTIITFNTSDIISSYVLYKGFLSVYPYVWLYDLSIYFRVDQFLFIRVYHAFLFAISAGVAIPYIITKVLCVENKIIPSFIFISVLLLLTWHTHIYTALMIDLPSFAFYVVTMSLVMVWHEIKINKLKYVATFAIGIMFGLVFSGSGQYALAGLILVVYFLYVVLNGRIKNSIKVGMIILLILGALLPKYSDHSFDKNIVTPMRASGEWIWTGSQWFSSSLSRMIDSYKYGFPSVNNRGKSIMFDQFGDVFEEKLTSAKSGAIFFTPLEYIKLIAKYPFDFLIMWFTKLFLALSFDGGKMSITHLLISYTAAFVFFLYIFRSGGLSQLLKSRNFYLGASVLATVAAPVLLHVEMRYSTPLIAYMICFAIYYLSDGISSFIKLNANRNIEARYFLNISNLVLAWFIFILFCLSFYGSIAETTSFEPSKILFRI